MADNKEKLFQEFPQILTAEWKEKVIADLKGADFDKKLVWRTSEGFSLQPMYRAEDVNLAESAPGEFPYLRGTKADNRWRVRQNVLVESPKQANAKILDLLGKGVDSLGLTVPSGIVSAQTISDLLSGVELEKVELNFKTCIKKAAALAEILENYFKSQNADLEKVTGSIEFDPFKKLLIKGQNFDNIWEAYAEVLEKGKNLLGFRVIAVNPVYFNNAGANCFQELGYGLAWGCDLISQLSERGFSACDVAGDLKFNFGIGGNYFMEIAKFRAARLLWAKITEAFGVECDCAKKIQVHATTSSWNKTNYDAYVNLLRTQTETMSAALAGVDSISVNPFDATFGTPSEFSERIARNQQLLLKDESNFDKVTDPSAGSYYIETLTNSIAEQAWKLFLEIEEKGGFYASVVSGEVQKAVNAAGLARREAVAKRRETLLGTNQFPNFNEQISDKIVEKAEEKSCGCSCNATLEKLDFTRGANDFEELRLATERASKRPKAFMLTIGNLAMRLARAQYSCNFFACAGYEVIDNLGFASVEEGVAAAKKAGADIVVLCSSDDEYAEFAPAAFKAVGGEMLFVVAGNPACAEDLKAAGIEHFIHVRVNVLESLKMFNEKLLK